MYTQFAFPQLKLIHEVDNGKGGAAVDGYTFVMYMGHVSNVVDGCFFSHGEDVKLKMAFGPRIKLARKGEAFEFLVKQNLLLAGSSDGWKLVKDTQDFAAPFYRAEVLELTTDCWEDPVKIVDDDVKDKEKKAAIRELRDAEAAIIGDCLKVNKPKESAEIGDNQMAMWADMCNLLTDSLWSKENRWKDEYPRMFNKVLHFIRQVKGRPSSLTHREVAVQLTRTFKSVMLPVECRTNSTDPADRSENALAMVQYCFPVKHYEREMAFKSLFAVAIKRSCFKPLADLVGDSEVGQEAYDGYISLCAVYCPSFDSHKFATMKHLCKPGVLPKSSYLSTHDGGLGGSEGTASQEEHLGAALKYREEGAKQRKDAPAKNEYVEEDQDFSMKITGHRSIEAPGQRLVAECQELYQTEEFQTGFLKDYREVKNGTSQQKAEVLATASNNTAKRFWLGNYRNLPPCPQEPKMWEDLERYTIRSAKDIPKTTRYIGQFMREELGLSATCGLEPTDADTTKAVAGKFGAINFEAMTEKVRRVRGRVTDLTINGRPMEHKDRYKQPALYKQMKPVAAVFLEAVGCGHKDIKGSHTLLMDRLEDRIDDTKGGNPRMVRDELFGEHHGAFIAFDVALRSAERRVQSLFSLPPMAFKEWKVCFTPDDSDYWAMDAAANSAERKVDEQREHLPSSFANVMPERSDRCSDIAVCYHPTSSLIFNGNILPLPFTLH